MDRLRELGSGFVQRLSRSVAWTVRQTQLVVDAERLRAARSWPDRLSAVSWPRAGVLAGGSAAIALVVGIAISGSESSPPEIRSHPPRLPSDTAWRASQAAERAMETDVSPALAKANRSVDPEDPS